MRTERGQAGPFSAAQLSRQLARGELAWTSDVWREGLGGFKHARRDQLLVLAVANARGLDSATTRLDSLPSLLHSSNAQLELASEDTRVEARASDPPPAMPTARLSGPPSTPSRGSLPSPRPARAGRVIAVALLAFVSGAFVAVGPTRLADFTRALPHALRIGGSRAQTPVRPGAKAHAATLGSSSAAARAGASASLAAVSGAPLSAQPQEAAPTARVRPLLASAEDVRAAFRRSAPIVLRCLPNPERGLALELTLAGATGRVHKLHITSPGLRPGARECVKEAFVDFQVAPFREPRQLFKYRYAW